MIDNDLAGNVIIAKSLSVNGYVKYVSGLIILGKIKNKHLI